MPRSVSQAATYSVLHAALSPVRGARDIKSCPSPIPEGNKRKKWVFSRLLNITECLLNRGHFSGIEQISH